MNRLTKSQARQLRLFNSWDIARKAKSILFIDYVPATSGLGAHYAYWSVIGIGIQTDPTNTFWFSSKGNKTFTVYGRENKAPVLKDAMDWCRWKYHIPGFEKDPYGAYQIMGTMRRVLKSIEHK